MKLNTDSSLLSLRLTPQPFPLGVRRVERASPFKADSAFQFIKIHSVVTDDRRCREVSTSSWWVIMTTLCLRWSSFQLGKQNRRMTTDT
ncbi:hypothetical protein SRHO_G00115270 [Serrasalmus rhombeus]